MFTLSGDLLHIQEKLLESQYSSQTPDNEFPRLFAGVVGARWPSLASLLPLTAQEVEEITTDKESCSQTDKALHVLEKWISKENVTYGQMCERLKTLTPLMF